MYITSDVLRHGFLEYEELSSAERVVEIGRHEVGRYMLRCAFKNETKRVGIRHNIVTDSKQATNGMGPHLKIHFLMHSLIPHFFVKS